MDYSLLSYQQYADLAHEQDACWEYLDNQHREIIVGVIWGKDPGFDLDMVWPQGASEAWKAEIYAEVDLKKYEDLIKKSNEWEFPQIPPSNLHGQDYTDAHEEYIKIISIMDIHGDMCRWEDDMECHLLFAENTWDKRDHRYSHIINRRSEVTMACDIIHIGENYLTGSCSLGKVFIPKNVWRNREYHNIDENKKLGAFMKIRFLGFNGCRKAKMPWRAEKIIGQVFHLEDRKN